MKKQLFMQVEILLEKQVELFLKSWNGLNFINKY
jgi:hypothetical protein